jgi:hypothetical protein
MNWPSIVKKHACDYIQSENLESITENKHVLLKEHWKQGFWGPLQGNIEELCLKWHSPNNLISSQVFAVNFFQGLAKSETGLRLLDVSQTLIPRYEFVDPVNSLSERGKGTNIDVTIFSKRCVRFYEVKYSEHNSQPCSTKKQNDICKEGGSDILSECPLSKCYGTQYMKCVRDEDGPINAEKFIELDNRCPGLRGEIYQFLRIIALSWAKSKIDKRKYRTYVVFPQRNKFILNELVHFKKCLKNGDDHLIPIYIEEVISRALKARNKTLIKWAKYMSRRYIPIGINNSD